MRFSQADRLTKNLRQSVFKGVNPAEQLQGNA